MIMTPLTFIFPFLGGAFKVAIPYLARSHLTEGGVGQIWFSLLISFGFLALCFVYLVLQVLILIFGRREWLIYHTRILRRDLSNHPLAVLALFAGVFSAVELLGLVYTTTAFPHSGISSIFVGLSLGQLSAAIICDTTGLLWDPKFLPWEATLAGGSLVYLGGFVFFSIGLSSCLTKPFVTLRFLLAFCCGVSALISYVLTRRMSCSLSSYWGGTSLATLVQTLVICVLVLVESREVVQYRPTIVGDTSSRFLYSSAILSLIIGSASIQFFGDSDGFYSALGPVAGGQILVAVLLEFFETAGVQDAIQWQELGYSTFSILTLCALLLVLVGSVAMWLGRWTTTTKEEDQNVQTTTTTTTTMMMMMAPNTSEDNDHNKVDSDDHKVDSTQTAGSPRITIVAADAA